METCLLLSELKVEVLLIPALPRPSASRPLCRRSSGRTSASGCGDERTRGHRTGSRHPDNRLGVVEQRGVGELLGAGNGVSHPLHQLLQGVVHKLVHVHGDHWVLLAAQHGAREGEIPTVLRNHAERKRWSRGLARNNL